jgi:hypothetical protein
VRVKPTKDGRDDAPVRLPHYQKRGRLDPQPEVTYLMLPDGVVKIGTRVKRSGLLLAPLKTDARELRFLQRLAAQSLIDYSGAR